MGARAQTRQRIESEPRLITGQHVSRVAELMASLPKNDSDPGALSTLLEANRELRHLEWPEPFNRTSHTIRIGDARNLDFIPDESVHLVVTSPPYWTLKEYNEHPEQMGAIDDYDAFLDELDKVWGHCLRILVPGGRVCCNVGDVCIARKRAGRHFVVPLHSDIQVRARRMGYDLLTPVLWAKISSGVTEVEGNGAGFYGKPYQPGAIIKNDVEHILFFRKGGKYRSVPMAAKALSMLSKSEMQAWFRSVWTDIPGTSNSRHPAPFPVTLASRLIRMFSFAGDTVLDPFLGTGTTVVAAMQSGRNSIGVELDAEYAKHAIARCRKEILQPRGVGATDVSLFVDAAEARGGAR
jgi:site-specific DNA-methyltransferase (adenine-specific)